MRVLKRVFLLFFIIFIFSSCIGSADNQSVILMIGDGMGYEQIKAAGLSYYGEEGSLTFESFPVKTSVTTYSADNNVTDSAASATAMATGHKVNNGIISKAVPGDGSSYQTVLEEYKASGKSAGVVTTATVSHATPAAFTAHNISRGNYSEIAEEIFTVTRPDVVFGGGGSSAGIDDIWLQTSGYEVAYNEEEMNQLTDLPACALFGDGYMPYVFDGLGEYPTLSEMSVTALNLLDHNSNGFFLMIEGGRIDHACHSNDIQKMLPEVKSFSDAVQSVLDWIGDRSDILLIVTADHETGGLNVLSGNGIGELPSVEWSTTGHTGAEVPVFADGVDDENISTAGDNCDIHDLIRTGN